MLSRNPIPVSHPTTLGDLVEDNHTTAEQRADREEREDRLAALKELTESVIDVPPGGTFEKVARPAADYEAIIRVGTAVVKVTVTQLSY